MSLFYLIYQMLCSQQNEKHKVVEDNLEQCLRIGERRSERRIFNTPDLLSEIAFILLCVL